MARRIRKFILLRDPSIEVRIPWIGARLAAIGISTFEVIKFSFVQFFFFEPGQRGLCLPLISFSCSFVLSVTEV